MNAIMRFSDALLLGATLPLCRGRFHVGESGCLMTNALKAVGRYHSRCFAPEECQKVWPDLFGAMALPPIRLIARLRGGDWYTVRIGHFVGGGPVYGYSRGSHLAEWIVSAFDEALYTPDQVAAAIRGLEDALGLYPEPAVVERLVADREAVAA